jgi:glycosyltransferase involved in cell wall biosynthesis
MSDPLPPRLPLIDIVVPAHNEAATLDANTTRLHRHLSSGRFPWPWQLTIAENASTDGTLEVAQGLASRLDGVRVVHLVGQGRGRALRRAWSTSTADIVAYMDADLSTDLACLPALIGAIASGRADVAIGSRLLPGAIVTRGTARELISQSYNLLVRTVLQTSFRDAQCGFKALRRDLADEVLPLVLDQGWFFDTELLTVAQRRGHRIVEVPVTWVDDPNSSVQVLPTALADLRGVVRMAGARRSDG